MFMGYAGAVWLLQFVCEGLFDVLFANLSVNKKLRAEAENLARERAMDVDRGVGDDITAPCAPGR